MPKQTVKQKEYNIFIQVVGGRALIRTELVGKDDAYEYIRGVNDNLDDSVFDCSNSKYEKQEIAVLTSGKVDMYPEFWTHIDL